MKNLKILSVIGIVLILIALGSTDNPRQYILETIGMLLVAGYAWSYIKDRIVMLWLSGFFIIAYAFLNYAFFDLIFWSVAFFFIYKEKIDREKI